MRLPDVDPQVLRDQLEVEELRSQVNTSQGLTLLIVSLLLFIGAQASFGAMADFIAALVIVLVVHELGHYAAMRAFGYRDTKMFFIPFLGAAVSGRHDDASGTQRAVVALAGPLPGIVLGMLAVWLLGPLSPFMATLGASHASRMRQLSHKLRLAEPALPSSILERPDLIGPLGTRLQQRFSPERAMAPRRMAMLLQRVWQDRKSVV